jgi:hypothetical protein
MAQPNAILVSAHWGYLNAMFTTPSDQDRASSDAHGGIKVQTRAGLKTRAPR